MKTLVKGIEIKKAVELTKPFVGSLRKKVDSRPILKTALITSDHVIVTDSHTLIRIKHNENVDQPYLNHYKPSTNGYGPESYPNTSRLIPDTDNAKETFTINIAEWFEAHTLALIAAKERNNKATILEGNKISVHAVEETVNKEGKKVKTELFDRVSFTYSLDTDTRVEKVAYNCEYMLMMLKVFKKLKIKEITCYFFGPQRPMVFKDKDGLIEILILPVRIIK